MAHPYWNKMTPEERSAEMKRRALVAKKRGKKMGRPKKHQSYKCSKCGKKFDDKYRLANHVRYQHPKKGVKNGRSSQTSEADHSNHISYLFGKVETIIEHYAASAGVSRSALASGVGSLLLGKEGR